MTKKERQRLYRYKLYEISVNMELESWNRHLRCTSLLICFFPCSVVRATSQRKLTGETPNLVQSSTGNIVCNYGDRIGSQNWFFGGFSTRDQKVQDPRPLWVVKKEGGLVRTCWPCITPMWAVLDCERWSSVVLGIGAFPCRDGGHGLLAPAFKSTWMSQLVNFSSCLCCQVVIQNVNLCFRDILCIWLLQFCPPFVHLMILYL